MKNLWIKLFGNQSSWGIILGFFNNLKKKIHYLLRRIKYENRV